MNIIEVNFESNIEDAEEKIKEVYTTPDLVTEKLIIGDTEVEVKVSKKEDINI